jgi:hypothetical protein
MKKEALDGWAQRDDDLQESVSAYKREFRCYVRFVLVARDFSYCHESLLVTVVVVVVVTDEWGLLW